MQAIKCELCGSNEFTKVDGLFQCNHCNTKYTLEEAKKLMVSGTVEVVKGNAEKERLLKNAETFLNLSHLDQAITAYSNITEQYPEAPEGWKGLLIIMANYGISSKYRIGYGTETFARNFIRIFNAYKTVSDTTDTIKTYGDALYKNICNGNITGFSDYDIEKLSGILSDSQISFIVTTGKINAQMINDLKMIDELLDNPPLSCYCKFCFAKSMFISYYSNHYDADGSLGHFKSKKIIDNEDLITKIKNKRTTNNLCQYCGGEFKGLFKKVCSNCGKPKDY